MVLAIAASHAEAVKLAVQRFSGRLKLNVKLLVEVQSTMTSNYIDVLCTCAILVVVMVDCTSTCNFT